MRCFPKQITPSSSSLGRGVTPGLHLQLQNGQPGGWGCGGGGPGSLSREVGGGGVDRKNPTGRPLGAEGRACLPPAGISALATLGLHPPPSPNQKQSKTKKYLSASVQRGAVPAALLNGGRGRPRGGAPSSRPEPWPSPGVPEGCAAKGRSGRFIRRLEKEMGPFWTPLKTDLFLVSKNHF